MRTSVPFALYEHRPLSVAARKQDVKTRRAGAAAAAAAPPTSPTLRALRQAGADLTARGLSPFSTEQLLAETLRRHPQMRRMTLRNALAGELLRPDAHLTAAPAARGVAGTAAPAAPATGTRTVAVAGRYLVMAAPSADRAVRPEADGRLCGEVVLDAVHHLTGLAARPQEAPEGVSVDEISAYLAAAGYYYEPSGIYRAVRRAREAGLLTTVHPRPLRVRLARDSSSERRDVPPPRPPGPVRAAQPGAATAVARPGVTVTDMIKTVRPAPMPR